MDPTVKSPDVSVEFGCELNSSFLGAVLFAQSFSNSVGTGSNLSRIFGSVRFVFLFCWVCQSRGEGQNWSGDRWMLFVAPKRTSDCI